MTNLGFVITIAAGVAPIPVIYLIYRRYFTEQGKIGEHIEYFAYGVLLAGLLFVTGLIFKPFSSTSNPLLKGFVHAALIEKGSAFLIIALLLFQIRDDFSIIDSVIKVMLLGLGFSALENILYAVTRHNSIIFIRFISSVPMHILTCGIIAYYLSLVRLSGLLLYRVFYFVPAFLLPVFFHVAYDSLLFAGGRYPYIVPFILVLLIIYMEYILARSQVLPGQKELRERNQNLEDHWTIEREPQFERWILRSMGAKNPEHVPFISVYFPKPKLIIIILLVLVASFSTLLHFCFSFKPANLSNVETIMLFIMLPALYAFDLISVGIINPDFFSKSLISIPIVIDSVFSIEVDDVRKEDDVVDAVTYHITPANSYFKTPVKLRTGTSVKCILYCSRFSSPTFEGEIVYDNHKRDEEFKGTLIRFTKYEPGFLLFLLRYYLYRWWRGISFNLHLPGSKEIRQLFVRPISVMQQEYTYKPGHVLFKQGGKGEEFYLLRKGSVNIMKKLKTGEEVLFSTLSRGEIFGEMAILGNQSRNASAICGEECVLAVARGDKLDVLIKNNPEFAEKLIETLAQRHHTSEHMFQKKFQQINRDMAKSNKLLFSLLKMSLAVSSSDKDKIDEKNFIKIAHQLRCDKSQIKELFESLLKSKSHSSVAEDIDGVLAKKIITKYGKG